MWRIFSVVVFVVAGYNFAHGQSSKSPMTAQGIGDINDMSMVHNDGMGGLGISVGSFWYMNNMNPALLPMNTLTVFGAGFALEKRSVFSSESSSTNSGGNLSYLGTAFPIINGRWTSAIGLTPYSTVDYQYHNKVLIPDSKGLAVSTFNGYGGFNQAYWANGFRIGKSLFLGVRASYLFSSIVEENTSAAIDSVNIISSHQTAVYNRLSVSDLKFTAGAVYKVDSIFNSRVNVNLGVLYDFKGDINASRFQTLERRDLLSVPFEVDTLLNNEDGALSLPSSLGFGLSFSRDFHWLVGLEVKMHHWSEYKNFNGGNEGLADGMRMALGGEFTPDYASVSNFFKRITYRAGFSYEQLPYVLNNNQVNEIGINFGLSLPVSRFSSIDLAVRYGKRGNVADTNIEEEVLRFGLGITFNDQWFIRRKYD